MLNKIKHQNVNIVQFRKFEHVPWQPLDVLLLTIISFALFNISRSGLFPADALQIGSLLNFILPYSSQALCIWLFLKMKGRGQSFRSLNLSFPLTKQAKEFLLIFSLLALSIFVFILFSKLMGHNIQLFRAAPNQNSYAMWQKAILALLCAPILEEILFSGIIYTGLRNKIGVLAASLIAGIIFSLFHHNFVSILSGHFWGFVFYFRIASEMLSFLLLEHTRSLYPSIVYHLFRNALILAVEFAALGA